MGYESSVLLASTDKDVLKKCVAYIEEQYVRDIEDKDESYRIEGIPFSMQKQVKDYYIAGGQLHSCSFEDLEHWLAIDGKEDLFKDVYFIANYAWVSGVITIQQPPLPPEDIVHYVVDNGVSSLTEFLYPATYSKAVKDLLLFVLEYYSIPCMVTNA